MRWEGLSAYCTSKEHQGYYQYIYIYIYIYKPGPKKAPKHGDERAVLLPSSLYLNDYCYVRGLFCKQGIDSILDRLDTGELGKPINIR